MCSPRLVADPNEYFENNQCTEFCDERTEIVARDKGGKQEYRIINKDKKKFCQIRVDDCLMTKNISKGIASNFSYK